MSFKSYREKLFFCTFFVLLWLIWLNFGTKNDVGEKLPDNEYDYYYVWVLSKIYYGRQGFFNTLIFFFQKKNSK